MGLQASDEMAARIAAAQSGNSWFDAHPLPTGSAAPGGNNLNLNTWTQSPVPTTNGGIMQVAPNAHVNVNGQGLGTLDEQAQFEQAAQALGIPLNQTRGKAPQIVAWLNQHGAPGWEASANADDWVKTPSGRQIDFSLSGSNAFQWADDSNGGGGTRAGASAISLADFGKFAQPYDKTFTAPTVDEARATPGYQFAQQEGQKAVDQSAASKGTLLTGGTVKANQIFGQGLADTTYGDTYQRKLTEYMNDYNIWRNGQNDIWGRLNNVADRGLTAALGATQ